MVQADSAVPHLEPGLVPLEQVPDSDASFGHISIPRFPRRLLFASDPTFGGRRIEMVPVFVADYMRDRWKKHFVVATDLVQQRNADTLKDEIRAALREILQEPWFRAAVAGVGNAVVRVAPEPAPESEAAQMPVEAPAAAGSRYVPKAGLIRRNKPAGVQE